MSVHQINVNGLYQGTLPSIRLSGSDFDIRDTSGYVLTQFKDGHIKTKNFDSSTVLQTLESIEQTMGSTIQIIDSSADLEFIDPSNNCVMRVGDGHIKTKFFDSSTIVQTIESSADLKFIDSSANCVLKINDGHIKTKNFNSKTLERTIDTKIAEAIAPLEPQANILYNKKVVFLGDSITAGSGASSSSKVYHQIFGQLAHCTVVPLGVGDSCIANNTINGSGRDRSQFIKRINSSNLANVDLLIVFGGTNDFTYDSKPIGELYSEENISSNTYRGTVRRIAPSDTDTFAGALHELILYIRSINPNLPIIFMTPMNRGDFGSPTYPNWSESNTHGQFLQDYQNTIIEICNFYSIPVFVSTHWMTQDFSTNSRAYAVDSLHPNDAGHALLGTTLYRWIKNNITL